MLNLIKSILPQILMLIGIAGMAVVVLRQARRSPQFWELTLQSAAIRGKKLMGAAERFKVYASANALRTTEKTLRLAKILALRLENFFSRKLEAITKRKSGAEPRLEFWKKMREKKGMIKRPVRTEAPVSPDELSQPASPPESASKEEVLARLAKEKSTPP